jgi:Zn-dependent protease with chaperone function
MTGPARPDVLALPTSTTLRMVLVAVALVVSALFVGTALYNAVHGRAWDEAVLACLGPGGVLPSTAAQLACEGPVERGRAEVAMLAAAATTVFAAALIALAPVLVRRRLRLVPVDARYARAVQAVTEIASAAGVRGPGVLIRPGPVSEPFCIGRPGDYRIVLPRKLALLGNPTLFDALVRHEVAHLVHRDVALSWLARSLWYVLGPLLALPALVFVARGEPALAVDILWRSAVLIGIVLLVVRGLMRAREHDADLRAARVPGVGHVLDVELSRHPVARSGWRAAIAWHPEVSRRRAVLTRSRGGDGAEPRRRCGPRLSGGPCSPDRR